MACWSTKATISLKRVKIEEKLLWRAYTETHQRSFEPDHPEPLRPPLPQDWGFATPIPKPKSPMVIISGMSEATDFNLAGSQGPFE